MSIFVSEHEFVLTKKCEIKNHKINNSLISHPENKAHWLGNMSYPEFTVIDTPGFGDNIT